MHTVSRPPSTNTHVNAGLMAVALAGMSIFLYGLSGPYDDGEMKLHLMLAGGFVIYLSAESAQLVRRHGVLALAEPPILATLVFFGASNLAGSIASIFYPEIRERFMDLVGWDYQSWLNHTLLLTGAAAFCMWRGYYLGGLPAEALLRNVFALRILRASVNPNWLAFGLMLAGSIAATLAMIWLGLYGYGLMESQADRYEGYLAYLKHLSGLGLFLEIIAALHYFDARRTSHRRRTAAGALAAGCFLTQIAFGLMTGFKGQVILPVLAAVFAYFVVYRRVRLWMFVGPAIALLIAYTLIQPYRASTRSSAGALDTTSITSIMTHLLQPDETVTLYDYGPVLDVVARSDTLGFSAAGLRFADGNSLGEADPAFAKTIWLSPVYAFIPRLIWSDKPSPSTGWWFGRTVLNRSYDDPTSIGMGPVAYTYFAGGVGGVCAAFFVLGIIQRLVFRSLTGCGLGGWIVYISVTQSLVVIPSDFGPMLSGLFQLIPLVVLAQYLVLKPD